MGFFANLYVVEGTAADLSALAFSEINVAAKASGY